MRSHGTRTKYMHDGCRCLPCRLANTRYETARTARHRLPWRVQHVGGDWWLAQHRETRAIAVRTHDRAAAFKVRDERNAVARRLDLRDPLWGCPAVARRHLLALRQHGIGIPEVSRRTGISRSGLRELVTGRSYHRDRPRRRRVKYFTLERILAVQTTMAAPGAAVAAAETWSQIDALRAVGWSKGRIARVLGRQRAALQLGRRYVRKRNALAIADLVARELATG